mmetsp:Transcript_8191/g.33596  ORF Transcript_8191/g.33596 Transcript_8191/m.33596 type:complete len:410 (+) Transcript_8191:1055-2284(+)
MRRRRARRGVRHEVRVRPLVHRDAPGILGVRPRGRRRENRGGGGRGRRPPARRGRRRRGGPRRGVRPRAYRHPPLRAGQVEPRGGSRRSRGSGDQGARDGKRARGVQTSAVLHLHAQVPQTDAPVDGPARAPPGDHRPRGSRGERVVGPRPGRREDGRGRREQILRIRPAAHRGRGGGDAEPVQDGRTRRHPPCRARRRHRGMSPSTAVGAAEGPRRRRVPDPLVPGARIGETARRRRPFRRPRRVPPPRARRRRRRHPGLPRGVPRRRGSGAGEGDRGGRDASGEIGERRRGRGGAHRESGENRQGQARALDGVHRERSASPRAHRHRRRRSLRRHAPRALAPRPVRAAPVPRVRDGGVARPAPGVRRETGAVPVRLARGVFRRRRRRRGRKPRGRGDGTLGGYSRVA